MCISKQKSIHAGYKSAYHTTYIENIEIENFVALFASIKNKYITCVCLLQIRTKRTVKIVETQRYVAK